MAAAVRDPDCIFCKIIDKSSPSWTVIETDKVICFLDIFPVSKGHSLIVPKYCGAKLTDIPDDYLVEILPVAKRVAQAIGCENYNVVQNNGALAYQEVFHCHFHVIPKTSTKDGLLTKKPKRLGFSQEEMGSILSEIKNRYM